MPYVVVTPPTNPPVFIDDAAAHLRLDAPQIEMVELYIAAAVAYLDGPAGVLGRCLGQQTIDYVVDGFPGHGGPITLEVGPVQSIVAIAYVDHAGADQVLASYWADEAQGRVWPAIGASWPSGVRSATVRYIAGHPPGQVSDVDRMLILAIVAHLHEHRGDAPEPIPLPLAEMIAARRRVVVG